MARKKASFSSFLFGIIFGIVATLGGIAYGGYWAYNNLSINKAEEITKQDFSFLDDILGADSVLRTYTISTIITKVSAIPNQTFGEFSEEYGITYPSEIAFLTDAMTAVKIGEVTSAVNILLESVRIGNVLGAPYNDFVTYPVDYTGEAPEGTESLLWEFRTYTIAGENGITNIMDTLTVGKLKNLLGFTLPEMLSGINDSTLISELGTAIDGMLIRDLIPEPAAGDDSMSAVLINKIRDLQRNDPDTGVLGYYTLGEFAELFSSVSDSIYVRDLLSSPDPSDTSMSATLIRTILDMKDPDTDDYYTIGNAGELFAGITNKLYVKDFIPQQADGTPMATIINKLRDKINPDTSDYYTLGDAGELFESIGSDIYVKDIISAPDPLDTSMSATLLRTILNMKDPDTNDFYTINNASELFAGITNELYIKDFIPEQAPGTPTATIINELREKINPATSDFYTMGEADELFAGIGDDIFVRDIIPEPSGTSGSVSQNLINKIRDMEDADTGEYYTINNIGKLFENVTSALTVQDIMEAPVDDGSVTYTIMSRIYNSGANFNNIADEINGIIGDLTIQDFMEEPDISDGTITSKIMHKIWNTDASINTLSADISTVVSSLTIQDLMEAPLNDGSVTYKIMSRIYNSNANFENISDEIGNIIGDLTIKDFMNEPTLDGSVTSKIMHKIWSTNASINTLSAEISGVISDLTIQDFMNEPTLDNTVTSTIMHDIWATNSSMENLTSNISGVIDALTIRDFISQPTDLTSVTGKIMNKLWLSDAPINNMSSAFSTVLDGLELRDVLVLPADPTSMSYKMINQLISQKPGTSDYYKLNEISLAIEDLTLSSLFGNSGIFAIIDPDQDLKLTDLSDSSIATRIGDATMLELYNAGLIQTLPSNPTMQAMSLNDFIEEINNMPF